MQGRDAKFRKHIRCDGAPIDLPLGSRGRRPCELSFVFDSEDNEDNDNEEDEGIEEDEEDDELVQFPSLSLLECRRPVCS